jgi:hypothetical protein
MRLPKMILAVALVSVCAATSSAQMPARDFSGAMNAQFQDRVGGPFRLESVTCVLDGITVCNKSGKLGKSFPLFSKNVSPGSHNLSITAVYSGEGGLFSYVDGFRYNVQSGSVVAVAAEDAARVTVMVRDVGGPTTPMAQRLRMGFVTR